MRYCYWGIWTGLLLSGWNKSVLIEYMNSVLSEYAWRSIPLAACFRCLAWADVFARRSKNVNIFVLCLLIRINARRLFFNLVYQKWKLFGCCHSKRDKTINGSLLTFLKFQWKKVLNSRQNNLKERETALIIEAVIL